MISLTFLFLFFIENHIIGVQCLVFYFNACLEDFVLLKLGLKSQILLFYSSWYFSDNVSF